MDDCTKPLSLSLGFLMGFLMMIYAYTAEIDKSIRYTELYPKLIKAECGKYDAATGIFKISNLRMKYEK